MAYTLIGWLNDQAPAINQTNLNKMDNELFNLSKLGDETINARIDASGNVYESIGAAIRAQTEDVNEKVELLDIYRLNLYNDALLSKGYYLNSDGSLRADSRFAVTHQIEVPNGKSIFLQSKRVSDGNVSTRGARAYCVYLPNNTVVYNDTLPSTNYYTNNTGAAVNIRFAIYYNYTGYEFTDYLIKIVDSASQIQPVRYVADVYHSRIVETVNGIADENGLLDNIVNPDKTTFLIPNKNLYDPTKQVDGYYVSTAGAILADSRYAYIVLSVPAGKIIYASASVNGSARQFANSVRQYCIKDRSGSVIDYDTSMSTAYKYKNTTSEEVYIYYTIFIAHPTIVVTDLMIEVVDNNSQVVLDEYVPHQYSFSSVINIEDNENEIKQISEIVKIPETYFVDEIKTTAETIRKLTNAPCLVYNIITDTHVRPADQTSVRQTQDSIANIAALNRISFADGVVHLGDMISQSAYTQDGYTDDEIYESLRDYIKKFSSLNRNAYLVNGNHDGHYANHYREKEWYSICGRLNENYVVREAATGYFYVDYPKLKVRTVFFATPDNIDDANTVVYGYTARMLDWFVNKALNVENDYAVIIFTHIAPFFTWYIPNGMENLTDFYGICNAFHNHTSYVGVVQSADFSSKSGTKMIAYICGHAHGDAVLAAGETVSGVDQQGNPVTTTNGMPCPVINIGAGVFTTGAMSNYGAVAPARTDRTVTQDLWDTMIFRPDLNKIYMIRFGAGNDREIAIS